MQSIDLSVVIPTLNEEKYIGKLLDSIINQTVLPKEVIVVDAKSKDKTKFEVEKRVKKVKNLIKFYQVKLFTVAYQRNFGGSKAVSKNILFLDADTSLIDNKTLERLNLYIQKNSPDVAMIVNSADSKDWKDIVYYLGWEYLCKISKVFNKPTAPGASLFIKKKVFEETKGFDPKVYVAEDTEFVQRVVRSGFKYEVIDYIKIPVSPRRLHKEGHLNYLIKNIIITVSIILFGYKKKNFNYEFGEW